MAVVVWWNKINSGITTTEEPLDKPIRIVNQSIVPAGEGDWDVSIRYEEVECPPSSPTISDGKSSEQSS